MRLSSLFSCFHWPVLFYCNNHVLSSAFSPPHLLIDGGARRLFSIHATTIHRGASLQQEEEEVQTVTSQQHQQQQHSIILANDEEFIKPLPDKRQYRAILLPNGLRALLVSSPQTDVEAAALHVQAGHFDDLRPGLAHFHEHMLFLGTQKYPSSEEFESYLSSNGGSSNAYTDMEDTNYYFSITPSQGRDTSALFGALDRFAQFFMAPLFDISMVEKELQAIDSEYRNSITSDSWRNYQLLKSASNPQHPFHKFGCGNYETLSPILEGNRGPRDDLLDFSKTYYKTNNMRLCVVGRASLDVLQTTVEQTFGNLPFSDPLQHRRRRRPGAGNKPPSLMDDDDDMPSSMTEFPTEHGQYTNERGEPVRAFDSHNLGMIRETIPLLESRSIKVAFAAPPLDDPLLQESRPYRVFSHILGHESPGSLHALLNNKGWIVGLTSGIGIDCSDFSLFTLTLSLTPEGMKHHHKVLDLVFEWIALLRNTDEATLKAHHDQLRQMADHNFQFRENGDATDFCSSAAELLFDYTHEPAKLLVGPTHAGEYNAKVGRAFLDRMTPEHAIITIINSDFSTMEENYKTEPWYKAKYRDVKMTPQQIEKWSNPPTIDPELHVPALNEYIPTNFTLKCGTVVTNDDDISLELQPPKLILDVHHNLRMWHKMDQYWKVPKTHIRVSLLTPNVYRSPRSMTYNRIYQRVLNDDLNSFVYDASVAGCSYRVACIPSGFRISVSGYSEKLPFLLETVTSRMLSLIEELKTGGNYGLQQKFEKAKANLLRETKNYKLDTPYEVASYNSRLLMEETVWYVDNYIDELEGDPPLTMEECAHVAEECLRGRLKAETLCIGNIDEAEAKNVANVVDKVFLKQSRPLLDVETPIFRSFKIPTLEECNTIFGPTDPLRSAPLVYQELAFSESEENNAVEFVLQAGCDFELGYEGVAILELIAHMAYNSAFHQLRTIEQLGYIVSSFARKAAGGSWALSTVVQSSVAEPTKLEERIQAWLVQFRAELEEMDAEDIATEAAAVVAQLMERDTKLSQEVSRAWSDIMLTESLSEPLKTPPFDRLERVCEQLIVNDDNEIVSKQTPTELKSKVLNLFDKYFVQESKFRRAMSSRVYSQKFKESYEAGLGQPGVLSKYDDIFDLKQYLSTWPIVPYWAEQSSKEKRKQQSLEST